MPRDRCRTTTGPYILRRLSSELPPGGGGDTQFANMVLAYGALPQPMQTRIADLQAVHSWEASWRNTNNRPASEEEKGDRPPVTHPLVRTHPDSGRKSLYIGIHTSHVVGMPEEEGAALLGEPLEHATPPQFVHTHHWRAGDVVMWDNRCLLHRALANYEMGRHRCVLHRTVVRGSVPHAGVRTRRGYRAPSAGSFTAWRIRRTSAV